MVAPATRASRSNRRWLLLLLMCPVVVGIVVYLEITTSGSAPEPVAHPTSVPAGYRAITDAYFGYAIPTGWKQETNYTDSDGDIFYGGAGGWAGESLRVQATQPPAGKDTPPTLGYFGEQGPTPYQLSAAQPVAIAGSKVAYRYSLTRPGGFDATVIEAWQAQSQTLLWLEVKADAPTTSSIVTSLAGYQPPPTSAG